MISIIVPIFNVEKYLSECLNSIISQSISDYEVLLINDGSTDKSGDICDEYAQKDSRFKVYHKQNGGVSSARNFALEKIQGDWVYFCDADDLLYEKTLEILIRKFDDSVDCTMGGYIKINEQGNIIEDNKNHEENYMSIEEILVDFYHSKYKMINGYIWNRLFRRCIIERYKLRFREDIYIKEDGLFLVQYLCKCRRGTFYTTEPVYKYIMHGSSAMNQKIKTINKESISRLTASLECYKEIKRANYTNILPIAEEHVFVIRQQLLITDKSKGLKRLSFRLNIDKMIAKELSVLSIINVYLQKFGLARR